MTVANLPEIVYSVGVPDDDPNFTYGAQAQVLKDSVSPEGVRVTTIDATMHRFVLAELNTHRKFSRNSASSRAIPLEKQHQRVKNYPAWPYEWRAEQSGMSGGKELEGDARLDAQQLFVDTRDAVVGLIEEYIARHEDKSERLHKSLVNRLLEPYMWHRVVITASDYEGFWAQRVHEDAQPEIHAAAKQMLEVYEQSEPQLLEHGEWHLPLIFQDGERDDYASAEHLLNTTEDEELAALQVVDLLKMVSTARCARTSYLSHQGVRDLLADVRLYRETLASAYPPHASPLEHVATPVDPAQTPWQHIPGNLTGWKQFRHEIFPSW